MLYQLHHTQQALLHPFSWFAEIAAVLFGHTLSPLSYIPLSRSVSASCDLLHRLTKEYGKPEWNIAPICVEGTSVQVHEEVIIEKAFCRLLRFNRETKNRNIARLMSAQPIVLLVAPLSGHHATLLRDTVQSLLQDHQVYITDWTDACTVPLEAGDFGLDDYVEYVQEFIRVLGSERVNVISVCQPTVPVLVAISLMASAGETTPRTMTLMGGPIDARKSPTTVNTLAVTKPLSWFEKNVIQSVPWGYPGVGRKVYPGFLQYAGFVAMNPSDHLGSHLDYYANLTRGYVDDAEAHRRFYDEYNATMDLPAPYYLDTIAKVFKEYALVKGTWKVQGQLVRPQDITRTALLTIEGDRDDISGSGQTRAAHTLCVGIPRKRHFHLNIDAGHFGIFSGSRWREETYPQVRDFIKQYAPKNH